MKKDEKYLFHSFKCGASYEDIRYQVHSSTKRKKQNGWVKRAIAITIPSVVVLSSIATFVIVIAQPAASNDNKNSAASDSVGKKDDASDSPSYEPGGKDENPGSDQSQEEAMPNYLTTVKFSFGTYREVTEDHSGSEASAVLSGFKEETFADVKGELLAAVIHTKDESSFKVDYPEVEYVLSDSYRNSYSESQRIFFYSYTDYPNKEYIICYFNESNQTLFMKS